ncbi:MAG: UPF0149 family protein [Gammaproteobacteria bacterium]|nr:UPF0149 family protein [Gammaproteobacteria bacterium]
MDVAPVPSFELVDHALRQLGAGDGATEAHGSFCGLVCILGERAGTVWVAGLLASAPAGSGPESADARLLGELAVATRAALDAGDMSFLPLLPPDDQPLAIRAEALAGWCAGFMHGLGEAAGGQAAHEVLGADTPREIMTDFAEITRLRLGADESDAQAEAAYTELVEFVRVSAQLLFDELYELRRALAAGRVH